MRQDILFLEPVFTHNVWGGTRLHDDFGYNVDGDDIGECWGIAAHQNGNCTVTNGNFKGEKLSKLWDEHRELFGNAKGVRFPLLVKIIDAKNDLSIQVHPNDIYAKEHENGSFGKMECWYILDCKKDEKIVIGHNAKTKKELEDMVNEKRWNDFIREIPIKKGDFLQIDPGTVHAIKGGTLILETQQNSDITYRVYDYDRLSSGKLRPLHIKQSFDVINVPAKSADDSVIEEKFTEGKNSLQQFIDCEYYKVFKINVNDNIEFTQDADFILMTVVEGSGTINGNEIKKGSNFVITSECDTVELDGKMQIVASVAK